MANLLRMAWNQIKSELAKKKNGFSMVSTYTFPYFINLILVSLKNIVLLNDFWPFFKYSISHKTKQKTQWNNCTSLC